METDHSTDTTTMTAVSPLHSLYSGGGVVGGVGGGTAGGSEHTYHRYYHGVMVLALVLLVGHLTPSPLIF